MTRPPRRQATSLVGRGDLADEGEDSTGGAEQPGRPTNAIVPSGMSCGRDACTTASAATPSKHAIRTGTGFMRSDSLVGGAQVVGAAGSGSWLLGAVAPTVSVVVIADTCYAGAFAHVADVACTLVLLGACADNQTKISGPTSEFIVRLENLVCPGGVPNLSCVSYRWLEGQLQRDTPDVERPQVWTNRSAAWARRPFELDSPAIRAGQMSSPPPRSRMCGWRGRCSPTEDALRTRIEVDLMRSSSGVLP